MFKLLFSLGCCYPNVSRWLVLITLFLAATLPARTATAQISSVAPVMSSLNPLPSASSVPQFSSDTPSESVDPLGSSYPVPWSWIIKTQSSFSKAGNSGLRYYRTPSLVSPDGQYAAYSRVQMEVASELYRCRVSSVMFLENLQTGELRVITASSPLAEQGLNDEEETDTIGTLSILMPVSWSEKGEQLLARQFEGVFSTSDATDFAVVWDRKTNKTTTISPEQVDYTNAVLLGWNPQTSGQVLFSAGIIGEEEWPVWSVATNGQTVLANQKEPIVYGQQMDKIWGGSQVLQ